MAPLLPESSVSPRDILSRLAQSVPRVAHTSDDADEHHSPTRTLSQQVASKVLPRQAATTTVVSEDGGGKVTLSGGAIAGIVIGSIAGFLLILWLVRSCTNWGRTDDWGETFEPGREKPARTHRTASYPYHQEVHRSRSRHSSHGHSRGHHGHSPRRSVEVRPVVYYEGQQRSSRGRSPRAPPPVVLDGRDLRRSSGSRSYRY